MVNPSHNPTSQSDVGFAEIKGIVWLCVTNQVTGVTKRRLSWQPNIGMFLGSRGGLVESKGILQVYRYNGT